MSDLRGINAPPAEVNTTAKLWAALIVVLMVTAAAAYTYSGKIWSASPPQTVAMRSPPPVEVPPMTPASTPPALPNESSYIQPPAPAKPPEVIGKRMSRTTHTPAVAHASGASVAAPPPAPALTAPTDTAVVPPVVAPTQDGSPPSSPAPSSPTSPPPQQP